MLKKLIYVMGLLMSLLAAEGLNRMSGLVAALKGTDAGFYRVFLIVAVVAAGVFLVALFKKIPGMIKWQMFTALLVSTGLMLNAPAFPVNKQIFVGLSLSTLASLAIITNRQSKKKQVHPGAQSEEKPVDQ